MWGVHEGMGWWMLIGSIWFVVFWGLVIYFVVWATGRGSRQQASGESPLDILKGRYASGEINQEEFDRMRRELS
jgi:putative membrane protein